MINLFKGLIIGLFLGAPVGAIGALCIKRTLTDGKKAGLITGLGSTLADCTYAALATLGVSLISDWILKYQNIIKVIGGIVIILIGILTLIKKSENKEDSEKNLDKNSKWKMFVLSVFIGITNPVALIVVMFAMSSMNMENIGLLGSVLVVLGTCIGTLIWWFILIFGTEKCKEKMTDKFFDKVNKIFGVIFILLGLLIIVKIFV